jgi:hypothetical protein
MQTQTVVEAAAALTQLHEPVNSWLEAVPASAGGRTLELYLATLEQRLQAGHWSSAVRSGMQLPEICSALEHPKMQTSLAHALCWCDAWVEARIRDVVIRDLTDLDTLGIMRSTEEQAEATAMPADQLGAALVRAARTWYRKRGACDTTVQQNLAKLRPQTYESLL